MLNSVKSQESFLWLQVVRLWPGYVEIKEMADSGELGDIWHMQAGVPRCKHGEIPGYDPNKGAGLYRICMCMILTF